MKSTLRCRPGVSTPLALCLMLAGVVSPLAARNRATEQAMAKIDAVIAEGPYKAYWQSLEDYQVPNWYADAKFGIFIHWGVDAVPAFDDWYFGHMYEKASPVYQHHIDTYGPQSKFGYKDLIPSLTFAKFDPAQYAALFKQAGAKFVVPVGEHHDGFPLYDCSYTMWNAARMGPKRDVVADLEVAVRKEGLHFGVSSHRAENWWMYHGGMEFDSDVRDPRYAGLYGPAKPKNTPPDQDFLEDWLARSCEIVDRFKPEVVWFDWWIEEPAFQPYLQKFAAYYYNRAAEWKQGAVINYKYRSFTEKSAVLDLERGQLDAIRPMVWQNDTSVSKNSWFHVSDPQYRTPDSLVDDLVDIVSKNGVLLLNVGPMADGTIPEPEQAILRGIGTWLAVNGEAIYGTRPWKIFGEGPTTRRRISDYQLPTFTAGDIRFTQKGDVLYAIALGWPEEGHLAVKSLGSDLPYYEKRMGKVELLGSGPDLKWSRNGDGLSIALPKQRPCDYAYAFKISPA
jgi:alpha-L-fucosidase